MAQMVYSFSRLTLYEECPYRFYLRYIAEEFEPTTLPLAFGKAIHKAIELILTGSNLDEALLIADMESELVLDHAELRALVEKAPIQKGEGLKEGVEVEKYFKLPLSDDPNAPFIQGYIDLVREIFGTVEFLDWKSNRVKYKPADTKQLSLYAWALSELFKTENIVGDLFFLRYFKRARERQTFTISDMENARAWAEKTATEIEDKLELMDKGEPIETLFPFKPNPHCKHCSFAANCLLKNENYIIGGII
ncbi:PD-(D/E)XK nuclease family protein [Robertmurraya massiliosenegalensis]|uniref:PD-(D/E)XK nuclease family protein n=1 Tax=Robertmurraya massiliosenegalensis TaxID=1287657 RepID=UPI000300F0C7|nr:PD-(D/E)XK nuclease family protein [Robertmurraya massiliosenegalensis]